MPRLKELYESELRARLKDDLGLSSMMQVPRVQKITLNMGVGEAKTDTKQLDAALEELTTIAGQRAQMRRARKSVASFKIREGMPIGARVTLRGARMWEFLDRLISIALPRIRDFRGLSPSSFDGRGNYSLGVREQIIFPEIDYDSISTIRGSRHRNHHERRERRAGARAPLRARHAVRGRGRTKGAVEKAWRRSHSASSSRARRATRCATTAACNRCGRPRAVFRKFGLCRICLRELAHQGGIPGMTKSSW